MVLPFEAKGRLSMAAFYRANLLAARMVVAALLLLLFIVVSTNVGLCLNHAAS